MTHKPPQGIDAPNCAHKLLKKQMVGEFVYYVCECGQKFRIEAWDGKVTVLAPPYPRKDLAALEELVAKWRAISDKDLGPTLHLKTKEETFAMAGIETGAKAVYKVCGEALKGALAEMRGAKR